MPLIANDIQAKSRSLQSLFGWLFGFGTFLLFSELAYRPLKAVVMAGDAEAAVAWTRFAGMAAEALPSLALLAALWSARAMFAAMATGDVLSPRSSAALGRVGDWLIVSAILGLALGPLDDQFDALGAAYFSALVVLAALGLAIRLLGRIHALAAEIAADHRQII